MNDKSFAYVQEWLLKASHDLKASEILLQSKAAGIPYDTVCFHCQQAVEKYIKAYLIHADVSFPRTHSLAYLILLCSVVEKDFLAYSEIVETLTPYAVDIRYPDDLNMPCEKDAIDAYNLACEIREFILGRLPKQ